jgi:hypothetical protein
MTDIIGHRIGLNEYSSGQSNPINLYQISRKWGDDETHTVAACADCADVYLYERFQSVERLMAMPICAYCLRRLYIWWLWRTSVPRPKIRPEPFVGQQARLPL